MGENCCFLPIFLSIAEMITLFILCKDSTEDIIDIDTRLFHVISFFMGPSCSPNRARTSFTLSYCCSVSGIVGQIDSRRQTLYEINVQTQESLSSIGSDSFWTITSS